MIKWGVLFFSMVWLTGLFAQNEDLYPPDWRPDSVSSKRVKLMAGIGVGGYAVSMTGLYFAWYKPYSSGKFHFFNDNGEWENLDKMGHSFTAYLVSDKAREMLWWSGMNNTQSTLYGTGYALLFQTTIEVFDGFSDGWGFSWGDMTANTIGATFYASQQLLWKEQRFRIKYSYSHSNYAQYRPDLLGRSWNERFLKDYNGQTYWLTGNISTFLPKKSKFPKWISVAGGYGANGMLGGYGNPTEVNGQPLPQFERYRQFYFSLDIDFTRIPTKSKFLKTVFIALDFIKIPFPAIEFNTKGETIFHPIMF